jgi:hypothetical protein
LRKQPCNASDVCAQQYAELFLKIQETWGTTGKKQELSSLTNRPENPVDHVLPKRPRNSDAFANFSMHKRLKI